MLEDAYANLATIPGCIKTGGKSVAGEMKCDDKATFSITGINIPLRGQSFAVVFGSLFSLTNVCDRQGAMFCSDTDDSRPSLYDMCIGWI